MKRNVYHLFCVLLTLLVCAGWVALLLFEFDRADDFTVYIVVLLLAACCMLLRLDSLVHESGHLLIGLLAGLKLRRVAFGWVSFGEGGVRFGNRHAAGETQFSLKKPQGAHAKLFAAAVGGAAFGIVFGAVMLVLFFVLPMHPALTFFTLFSVWCFAEAIMELLPADLAAGRTDGLVLKELIGKTGETEVAVRIMQAQIFAKDGDYACIPRELLYEVPVVREDSPVFAELLRIRSAYCRSIGDVTGAAAAEERLLALAQEE